MPETQYKKLLSCDKKEKCDEGIALAKMGKPAYQFITKSLADEDIWVRMFMAEALGNIGDTEAIPNLLPLLKDEDQMVRFYAADALGNIGSKEVIPYLQEVCENDNCFVRM
ncbi:MAG: HEAT repeat domain-containing protein, partial [Methanomicrobiales archaeon HGW-Methanomicrobiales-4]